MKKMQNPQKPFWTRILGWVNLLPKSSDENRDRLKGNQLACEDYFSFSADKGTFSDKTAIKTPFLNEYPSRYQIGVSSAVCDLYFKRLKKTIYRQLDSIRSSRPDGVVDTPFMFRESGELEGKRYYFFLKPLGEPGWLFERAGYGWIISRCEKIYAQDTFVRRSTAWDAVTLYSSIAGNAPPRVASMRAQNEIISFPVYEAYMINSLGIDDLKKEYNKELAL
ncbi:MAG: hypothetical protein R3B45_14800 [Bdellovibrionota bacterium]